MNSTLPSAATSIDWRLVIMIVALGVSLLALGLQLRTGLPQKRLNVITQVFSRCKARGYELMDNKELSPDQAWEWIDRVAQFFNAAIGEHAKRLVLQACPTHKDMQEFVEPAGAIQMTLTTMHRHITPMLTPHSVQPGFKYRRWQEWSPSQPIPK